MELQLNRPLIIFDLETTGVNVSKDRIIEICMLKVNPDQSHEIKTMRINPTIPIPAESNAIHGISDEDVKDCPTFAELARTISHFIDNADLVGFNSNKFDIPLLVEEFLRADVDFDIKNRRFIDVQNIFHKMEPRNLAAAYKFYCNKEHINAHQAEADTIATYEILKSQLEKYKDIEYKDQDGNISVPIVNKVQALHDFSFNNHNVDLIGHIVYNNKKEEVFNFGKHKGKTLTEIFKKEPSYYDWMMKGDFPLTTKKVITAIKLRGMNK
jgi:DNA polymerase III subunit epsilon